MQHNMYWWGTLCEGEWVSAHVGGMCSFVDSCKLAFIFPPRIEYMHYGFCILRACTCVCVCVCVCVCARVCVWVDDFVGLLLSHQRFTADQNCGEYPCTQNLAGNHSNCCVVALSHLTLGGCLLGQSQAEITHVHTHTHTKTKKTTHRWD